MHSYLKKTKKGSRMILRKMIMFRILYLLRNLISLCLMLILLMKFYKT